MVKAFLSLTAITGAIVGSGQELPLQVCAGRSRLGNIMSVLRYPRNNLVTSLQDPFLIMVDWLGCLCANDYVVQLLQRVHALSPNEAQDRAVQIIPHVRIAASYIHQSLDGPSDISFLPAYYAILNLMKVYVLLGPRHADLPKHRWHGVTYDVHKKDSHSILTEIITLRKNGVFPLFYQTVTGKILTDNKAKLRMNDILPYVTGVGYEYELAVGCEWLLCLLKLDYVSTKKGTRPRIKTIPPHGVNVAKRQLKVLREFSGQQKQPNVFLGKPIDNPSNQDENTREQLNAYLLYRLSPNLQFTPICSKNIEMPEELPIALLFFYMSSIVRYKPEFFSRLQDSKFWPLLSSARTHSFHAFLLAFWSFVHQENVFINP